ncbi:MAG: SulP family inorganic anion transporter [Acutalibacteraceae bacterium]|nr:SulP family inorganic anion transporter [Clostridia bacterium]MEE3449647.1 SulP family inorganic anion transporter [Acutalibacteraceae bacterium]
MLKGLKACKKNNLKNDIISGIIIALVSIPISMGYAQIAGLPAQYGLYGSVFPVLLFAVFSSSPQYIFGVDAAPAALVGGTLVSMEIAFESVQAIEFVPLITFFTGIWLLLFTMLKFGSLTRFVSSPVMGGFISGICATIILMQTPKLFGGNAGTGELFELIAHIISEFKEYFNFLSLSISIFCIFIIQLFKKIMPKLPVSAFVMILGALLQLAFNYCGAWNIKTLPAVSRGIIAPSIPDFKPEYILTALLSSFSIAVVIGSETLLAEKNFAQKNGYKIDDNSELLAFSVCNISSAFFGVCPVNGSVSRTSMNDQFGGKSQVTSVTAAAIMTIILCFATGFIKYLPVPVLTSIVVCALWSGTEFHLAAKLSKSSRKEFLIFSAAFLGVLIFGTIYGVIIGVILSFFNIVIRESAPPTAFLGVIPGRNHFYNLQTYAKSRPIKHVIIYRFKGNLFFANVDIFREEIEKAIQSDTKYVIVDASGISSIDTTGAQTLELMYRELSQKGIRFFLVEHISKVNEEIRSYGIGHIIESGGVRKTITDALSAVGYNRPYPLCETGNNSVSEDTAILQEFEWAFGKDARRYIDLYTEKILRKAKAIDPESGHADDDFAHLWDGISPISDNILLDYIEGKTHDLSEKYDIDESIICLILKNHRSELIDNRSN